MDEPVQTYRLSQVPHRERLCPQDDHNAHELVHGYLVYRPSCSNDPDPEVKICDSCHKSLVAEGTSPEGGGKGCGKDKIGQVGSDGDQDIADS